MFEKANNKRNTSGFAGVHHRVIHVKKKSTGVTYAYHKWVANWSECTAAGGIEWRFKPEEEQSEQEAFVQAVLARKYKTVGLTRIKNELEKVKKSGEFEQILKQREERRRELGQS